MKDEWTPKTEVEQFEQALKETSSKRGAAGLLAAALGKACGEPEPELAGRTKYCINDPCDAEAVTEMNGKPYCYTCAKAYDLGYAAGEADSNAWWKEYVGKP